MTRRSGLAFSISLCLLGCNGGTNPAEGGEGETADSGDGDGDPGDGDGDSGDGDGDGDGENLRPNWHQDIAPLVTHSCQGCHQDGGIAPFSMQTYDETWIWATIMADVTEAGEMPPWHAVDTPECAPTIPFEHDPRLTAEAIELLRDWADIGAPEGDPTLAAPLPEPPDLDLANPTTTVLMETPVTIEAEGSDLDFFHCISLDPGHGQDIYLDGLQVVPGNRSILHHVLVYVDQNGASAAWPGGVLEDCNGGTGIAGPTELVAGWVPGGLPMEPPEGVSITVPAGARLLLNVHYHATGGGPEQDDGTGLALRWTTTPTEYTSLFRLLGAPGAGNSLTGPLMIPAGASGHVESYEWVVSNNGQSFPDSVEARVWAVAHHMHKVGVAERMWIEDRDTGATTCLLSTPVWDFDWQRVYEYDTPADMGVRIKAGDIVHVECTYDNTLDNPGVVEALAEAGLSDPVDVGQGEGTLDEMCLGAVGVGVKLP